MKWIQYKIHTLTDAVDLIGEVLAAQGILGFEITDHVPLTSWEEKQMFTDIPAKLPPDDGTAVITFYTESGSTEEEDSFYSTGSSLRDEALSKEGLTPSFQSPEERIAFLQKRITEFGFPTPEIEYSLQDDSEWKDKWKENFHSFRVSDDMIVKPIWEDIPEYATASDKIIQIEPGSAFGTGTHETTRLCMTALEKYITPDTTLLDAGCGSGILAISALISGAKYAFCLDIDPLAVEGTKNNALLNQLDEERIQAIQANILNDTQQVLSLAPVPFDIVVANILADIIVPLSDIIGPFLKKDGIFLSSGILTEKAGEVRQALQKNHFTILEEHTLGEWVAITARKESNTKGS